MATITLKGNTIHTVGTLPQVGSKAPDFLLTKTSLEDVTLQSFRGMTKILNIVPSLDTGVCAASARRFDKEISALENTVCLTVSCDLPFAADRFCKAEQVANVVTVSALRDRSFGKDYQCEIADGPLAGLLSRAIVVLDGADRVVYTEQVPEITQEPDYDKALEAARSAN